jgi:hypothetical protein
MKKVMVVCEIDWLSEKTIEMLEGSAKDRADFIDVLFSDVRLEDFFMVIDGNAYKND